MKKIPLLAVLMLITTLFFPLMVEPVGASSPSTYTWVQDSWIGGADNVSFPAHPVNQTNWTRFYSKDVGITAGTELTLTPTIGFITQTTDIDFNAGTLTNVTVVGTGIPAEVRLAPVVVFSDDFEDGTLSPWTADIAARAGVATHTAQSGIHSMFTRHNPVNVDSPIIDLAGAVSATLAIWIRRGCNTFNNQPEGVENLLVQYLNNFGVWVTLETFPGSGTPGAIYIRNYTLPSDAFHAGFQVRISQAEGSGVGFDYWHIDDVVVTRDEHVSTGNLVSSTINTFNPNPDFTTLDFTISEPVNTDLKFQLRTADTEAGLVTAPWLGPDGTGTTYYTVSTTPINSASHDGHRWIQYKAFFNTTNTTVTPSLADITINYQFYPASLTQTTDVDFNAGTLTNVTVVGTGTPAEVRLDTTSVTVFSDDFEDGTLSPWTADIAARAGVATHTAQSGIHSMFTRHDPVNVDSPIIDLAGAVSATLAIWIRRGCNTFNNQPEGVENLLVQYLNNFGVWVTLETFPGSGTPGAIYIRNYTLPSDAFHAGFRIRISQAEGSGVGFDYWHIDDVIVTKSEYISPGNFISPVIDTGQNSDFTTLAFTIAEPIGTDLKFQLRTATTSAELATAPWLGPDGTNLTYYEVSTTAINPIHDGHRWIQYKAFFNTTNTTVTPSLADITINYQFSASLISSPFNTTDPQHALVNITWSETLPADTDIRFQLRTSLDNINWTSWMGPNGTNLTYFTDPTGGEEIPIALSDGTDDQWIQYRVWLTTTDSSVTPTLLYVALSYRDVVAPTFSHAGHNTTIAGDPVLFYIKYDDNVALHPSGQWIFSTNNTGTWVNDSAVNWTATPEWANVTKTLNSTVGVTIGYRWYAFDNAGNWNSTPIYTLTTTEAPYVAITVTPPDVNFGIVPLGTTNQTMGDTINATNIGTATGNMEIKAFNTSAWTLTYANDTTALGGEQFFLNHNEIGWWEPINLTYSNLATGVAAGSSILFDLRIGVSSDTIATVEQTTNVTIRIVAA